MRIGPVVLVVVFAGFETVSCLAEPGKNAPDPAPAAPAINVKAPPAVTAELGSLDLDDTVEPFVPVKARTEEETDRIEAIGQFATARIDEQEDRLYQALRRYQRAARFDPASQVARRQAVVLAMRMADAESTQQNKEGYWKAALRYAAQGDLGIDDARVLNQLAQLFAQHAHYADALRYFHRARELQPEKLSLGYVILSLDVGRMAYLTREFAAAADAFAVVMEALEHPDQYGLDERLQKRLLAASDGATNRAQLYLLFAEAFLSADRFDQAAAALEKANRLSPNAAAHAYRTARLEELRKQPAKAKELLQKYFDAKETSEGLAPYQLLVKLLNDLGRSDDLISTLEGLRGGDPDNDLLGLFLAEQYRAAEQFDKAGPLYSAVLVKSPSSIAYQGLAATRHRLKQTEALLDLLGDVAAKTGSLDLLGDETRSIAADAEMVSALVQLARDKHKADADSLGYGSRLSLAIIALEAGRFDDAAEFFERAMKINRESAKDVYRAWGVGLFTKLRYDDAAAVLQRAIDERAIASGDPTFHFLLSGALVMAGRVDEAVAAAEHAASLAPRSLQVAGRVAWVMYYAKRHEEAAKAYEELVRRFDEQDQTDEGRQQLHNARMVLSNIAVIQHDTPAAEEWLSQVLDEFPDDIGAQNDLGYLWADQSKHLKRAQTMVERAVAAEPENAAFRDSLGWVLHRLGRHDEAVAELKKAVAGDEPDGVMLEHLGDACLAAGQGDAAGDAWRKAQAAFEKEGDADKIARIKQKLADQPCKANAAD